jgi:multiple sugar transport system substrate-binding protein
MPAGLAGAAGLPGAPPGQGSGQAPNQAFNQAQGQALNQAPPAQAPPVGEPNFPGEPDFPQNSGQQPIFAQIKNNPLKFLPFALGGVAIIAILIVVGSKLLGGGQPDVGGTEPGGETNTAANSGDNSPSVGGNTSSTGTADTNTTGAGAGDNVILTYWGLWEPSSVLQDVLKDFEQQHPGVSVDYHKQSHKDYYSRLQTAIASGNGPDVFRYHATWVPMLSEELAAMPNSVMTASKYKQTFYPIVSEQLQFNGQVVGIPLMYDGLALFYNKDILQAANSEVPKTWGELKLLADQLTVRSEGQVERGGLAIGNTSNVQHWSDILGLLIYQNGGDPAQPVSSEVRDAIKFYVSFGQDEPVYTTSLPGATTAFIREEVAMMFGPSWRALQIKNAKPDLQFGIAPVPKLSEQELAWASYWAEGVSSKSKNQEEAWALLQYLSSKATLQKLYSAQSKTRAFGAIYPRRDLADEISDSLVAAYLLDAANARSWYLCSFTHDDGINDKIIDYYQDAVNKMAEGESEEEVLQTLSQGVKQVLRQYDAGE